MVALHAGGARRGRFEGGPLVTAPLEERPTEPGPPPEGCEDDGDTHKTMLPPPPVDLAD